MAYKASGLVWKTIVNGTVKEATTHFGTKYTLRKIGMQDWETVCVDSTFQGGVILVSGVKYADARKAAMDDCAANGGR